MELAPRATMEEIKAWGEKEIMLMIKGLIRERKLSQKSIAEQIGCSRIALSRYLNGHSDMRLSSFLKLLRLLNIQLSNKGIA